MSERNANRPGYKKTRVGWIPEEWRLKRIDEIGNVITGGTPSKSDETNYGNFLPWITASDMGRKYIFDTEIKLSEHGAKKGRIAPRGAVLVTCIASIGLNGIITEKMGFNQQINAVVVNSENNNEFFYYLIDFYKHRMIRLAGKTAVPIINKSNFQSLILPIPSLNEQNIIAEILSTWDRAIEQTQQLIDAKRRLKKGLMQQLLTGRMRFPGFGPPVDKVGELPEGWEEKRIEDIGSLYNGLTGKTKLDFGKGKPFIPYTNIMNNSAIDPNNFGYVKITSSEKQNRVKYGDALFTASSETAKEISMSSVVLTDVDECYLNSFCFGLRFKDLDNLLPEYARYLFRSSKLRKSLLPLAQGFTRYNISKTSFLKIKLTLPKNEEQNKIAAILEITESDINNLQKKINYYHKVKKGLLQVLLSGEVRV